MAGLWELVKIAKGGEKQEPWILFKKRDEFARPKAEYDVVTRAAGQRDRQAAASADGKPLGSAHPSEGRRGLQSAATQASPARSRRPCRRR